ncbi:uncharacterized protein F5891DRAFT_1195053 [Suillus fuscotomentosus]|uniref:Uncharacterized protein n=1 Tax=Suillus fuscotomentosus TaxID=1912939 RepID=A0AAD4HFI2_9AGAM|nr:uncharacterized protein F5891DRAFT_1195053 [Suillus fuscotomentosus]KAG1894612.1 hypothetical protein F5891DRAFT_1195053 [Suillus fuscotomentosus]
MDKTVVGVKRDEKREVELFGEPRDQGFVKGGRDLDLERVFKVAESANRIERWRVGEATSDQGGFSPRSASSAPSIPPLTCADAARRDLQFGVLVQ